MSKTKQEKKKGQNFLRPIIILAFIVIGFWLGSSNAQVKSFIAKFNPSPTPKAELTAEVLAEQVIPNKGYTVDLDWGNTGKKLVEAGGIDLEKYKENYSDKKYKDLLTYLTDDKKEGITINSDS